MINSHRVVLLFASLVLIMGRGNTDINSQTKLLLTGDTNRDGKVDFASDPEGRNTWSDQRGAVFMFNNDSDQNNGKQDCSDKVVNGPNDLLDLAPALIRQVPQLKDGGTLSISVSEAARPYVHIFYKDGSDYVFVENNDGQEIPLRLLKNGDVELRLEANSYACPSWDGKAEVTAVLGSPGDTQSDSVQLKVAPFIMLSAVQPALRIYVRDYPGKNERFIQSLKEITAQIGVELKIIGPGTYPPWEIWLQDVMEIGYSKTPLRGNPVVLKANRGSPLDDMPEKEMLGPDHGWFQCGEFRPEMGGGRRGDGWLDWYGNLEVTPPLPGQPFGRIFYGYDKSTGNSLNPQIVRMLEAQGVQAPLIKINTGWLLIKHVDEIFNFVPALGKAGKGFKLLVPDAALTYRLLDGWNAEGKGNLPILKEVTANETIASFEKKQELRDFNFRLQREEIEQSIGEMKSAIGIDESDIIRIPALFEKYENYAPALMPNMVNAAFMNGHLLMADPRGPIENQKDLVQEYVRGLLSKEGVEVHFVDDLAYHNRGGNVHCATNVTRAFY